MTNSDFWKRRHFSCSHLPRSPSTENGVYLTNYTTVRDQYTMTRSFQVRFPPFVKATILNRSTMDYVSYLSSHLTDWLIVKHCLNYLGKFNWSFVALGNCNLASPYLYLSIIKLSNSAENHKLRWLETSWIYISPFSKGSKSSRTKIAQLVLKSLAIKEEL